MGDLPDTQQQLVDDLQEADAPDWLVIEAEHLEFHDFQNEKYPMPKAQLVVYCRNEGLDDIAQQAINGRYDDEYGG